MAEAKTGPAVEFAVELEVAFPLLPLLKPNPVPLPPFPPTV